MTSETKQHQLLEIYRRLFDRYGPQHWWPAEGPFEVIVGAILTQSAAWTNVEKGIANLKKAGALSPEGLLRLPLAELAEFVHPCGYYNAKSIKLKAFADWLYSAYGGNLDDLFSHNLQAIRPKLLEVHGIGEETADSILLYAGQKPVFVIDAYTRRIIDRFGLQPRGDKYRHYQALFMRHLPHRHQLFNEYHALLVALGKDVCRKSQPVCTRCCLSDICRQRSQGPHKSEAESVMIT